MNQVLAFATSILLNSVKYPVKLFGAKAAWNLEVVPWLALLAAFYFLGAARIWSKAGFGHGLRVGKVLAFLGAFISLVAALVSPLSDLAHQMFSAHMLQHTLLIFITAPLLVLSSIPGAMLWALPRRWVHHAAKGWRHAVPLQHAWETVSGVWFSWTLFAFFFWVWHLPSLYQAALENDSLHALEHFIFLATACLFWQFLFQKTGQTPIHYGVNVLYLFAATLQMSALGALITFASSPWYALYRTTGAAFSHLDPLADQQLAGLLMWVPGGVLFFGLCAWYFICWMNAMDQRMDEKQING